MGKEYRRQPNRRSQRSLHSNRKNGSNPRRKWRPHCQHSLGGLNHGTNDETISLACSNASLRLFYLKGRRNGHHRARGLQHEQAWRLSLDKGFSTQRAGGLRL